MFILPVLSTPWTKPPPSRTRQPRSSASGHSDEVRQAAGTLFEMMDVDGDGVVTEAERPRRDR